MVASLWKVDDDATAELMSHFYANMLRENMPPAAALRAAKLEMWKQERRRPAFYWAGFVLQGEYSEELGVSRRWKWNQTLAVATLLALLVFCLYAVVWIRRRARKA